MASNPATTADLEKLRRDLETRIRTLEQGAGRANTDPAVTRSLQTLTTGLRTIGEKAAGLERKIEANAGIKDEVDRLRTLSRTITTLNQDIFTLQGEVRTLQQVMARQGR